MARAKTGIISRRRLIAGMVVAGAVPAALRGQAGPASTPAFTPETFGARGDGRFNDSAAFRRLAQAVNLAGGGRIVLRRTVYLVGEQERGLPGSPFSFAPGAVLRLSRCARGVSIEGNGATLRCAPGLRYGTFDRASGRSVELPMPNTRPGTVATPYDYMILIEECRGPVSVADLELDGSVGTHRIGGPWGDTGRQIACDGLFLRDNGGDEVVRNLHTHHHARDGMMLAGPTTLPAVARRSFTGIRSEWNGRQGCSLIGGSGYAFADCRFAHTGRGPVSTAPGAGVDIEAEGAPIRRLRFDRCVFEDNAGCGLVADSGDSADARFADCRFVGTTNWSVWPNKPGFRFDRCMIVGAAVRFFGSADPLKATRFFDCRFTDAPTRSGRRAFAQGPLADVSDSRNILFARCRFDATRGARLPWSTNAVYDSCIMRQVGGGDAYPRGTFRGTNRIDGPVDIAASRVSGRLVLNGRVIAPNA
jgi:hypothetical protein